VIRTESNHWQSISHNYFQAKYFANIKKYLRICIVSTKYAKSINYHFITEVCKILRISIIMVNEL